MANEYLTRLEYSELLTALDLSLDTYKNNYLINKRGVHCFHNTSFSAKSYWFTNIYINNIGQTVPHYFSVDLSQRRLTIEGYGYTLKNAIIDAINKMTAITVF